MIKILIKEFIGNGPDDGIRFLNKYAKKLAARGHDVSKLKFLGAGMNGYAYEMPDGRVIKLTVDHTEAQASRILVGKKTTYIANIYDTFQFKGTNNYGIVMEKLSPPSSEEVDFWNWVNDLGVLSDALAVTFKPVPWEEFSIDVEDVLKDRSIVTAPDAKKVMAGLLKYNFPQMIEELSRHGIKYNDYHGDNIMKRGKTSVIIDLGYSEIQNSEDIQVVEKINNTLVSK